ncbi:MAG TPA: phospholipid carrier-dependent glycosyltransferase [Desulfuromonadales bacterium]|nr:phospholipid carrier-dependent glycosyltransferase [Desulfuromonadales bacterium]
MMRILVTIVLLLHMAPCLSAAGIPPAQSDGAILNAREWSQYDWNGTAANTGAARFMIVQNTDAAELLIVASAPNDARFVRDVAVEPDTVYLFSCQARSKNIGSDARGVNISVKDILGGSPEIPANEKEWQTLAFYGKTGPEQRKISVTVGIGGYGSVNSGTAWFRNISVRKAASVPADISVVPLLPADASSPPPAGTNRAGGLVIAVLGCFGLLMAWWGTILGKQNSRTGEEVTQNTVLTSEPQEKVERRDMAVMGALAAVCLLVSLFNLGGHHAPETGRLAATSGEFITVEFGREVDLSRIYYYCGINNREGDDKQYTFAARTSSGAFETVTSFVKKDSNTWKYREVAIRTTAVRLVANAPGSRLNELAFVEKGSRTPLTGLKIGATNFTNSRFGKPENLIDEQTAFEYAPSFRTGFYFDEIYHARTAWEMLNLIEPYETTHPPLGKTLIAAGIAVFGMNPFGWRSVGALFGVALVPLMYLLGLKLFRNRFYAFCTSFLMLVEFMRFAQTRVAVIDVYGVFFILIIYYLLLDLFPEKGETSRRSVTRTIFLAGIAFGVGAACKWIVLYAGCGMALLAVLRTLADLRCRNYPESRSAVTFVLQRIGLCLIAFGAVPAVIYLLAYIPFLLIPGPGHELADVFRIQAHMLDYHRTLKATHPFSSAWWTWPLNLYPMWMYTGEGLSTGTASSIVSFGNPAVFWVGVPAVAATAVHAIRTRDSKSGVILLALICQYLPWIGINRMAFIYHFFSTVPFMILCIVTALKSAENCCPHFRRVTWGYLGIAAGLFIIFYPVLSGMHISRDYIAMLKWFPTWYF